MYGLGLQQVVQQLCAPSHQCSCCSRHQIRQDSCRRLYSAKHLLPSLLAKGSDRVTADVMIHKISLIRLNSPLEFA